ncbi:cyclophane-forming radical SAM peptide maturase AmcB [Nocardiopsis sp. YSL2]|uniref:cyclophane-forming radical SAM peptide maturase AmcB n=1 Tax=Nocardiopsis sp. YSL2 TaxID=2939492 RepID=UPI0026F45392|nr:cyclophane-forming radical SAM peptide maturase AmcB [Nocardiopsis sp. YSL2]
MSSTFHTLILQPTTLCNLNCSYCYLCPSERRSRVEMSVDVARAVAAGVREQQSGHVVDVVWHGGEPLTTRREHFRDLVEAFEPLRQQGKIRHYVQTNATLIDDAWCDFLTAHDFHVGVSIDGPEIANSNRVDWSGTPVHRRIMRGVDMLRGHGIEFSAICVATAESITDPGPLFDFFEVLGARSVGFNIEEFEGANTTRETVDPLAVRRFWREMFERLSRGSRMRVREADRLLGYLADVKAGRGPGWVSAPHDPIPTVGTSGDTVVLSPELLGVRAPAYDDFIVGNVLETSLPSIVARAREAAYVKEHFQVVERCQRTCDFFAFCQGGQASNRYFETGGFATTETAYCRNAKQELVLALAENMGV